MTKLYTRLGVDPQTEIALEHRLSALAICLKGGVDIARSKWLTASFRQQVALAYYLLEDRSAARHHATLLVAEAVDYLFGDWRETYTQLRWVEDRSHPEGGYKRPVVFGQDGCRRELMWMEVFRDGLLWALCLNDQQNVLRLAEYPRDDVREQEPDFGPVDKAWRVLAASLLRLKPFADCASCEQVIEKSRSKHARLLLAALRAIANRNSDSLRKALAECVKHHIRTKPPERSLDTKFALDASVVLHIARNAGIPTDLPANLIDHAIAAECYT